MRRECTNDDDEHEDKSDGERRAEARCARARREVGRVVRAKGHETRAAVVEAGAVMAR